MRVARWRSEPGRREYRAAYDEALSLWPVPFVSREFETRFGSTHVLSSGPEDAAPLLLLPAAMGAGALQWFANAAHLAQQHRIHAVDFVGAPGKGTQTRAITTRADCADWLRDLFEAIELERPAVVGSSQGGWFALNLAIDTPESVADLALLAPAAGLLPFRRPVLASLRLGPWMPAWTAGPTLRMNFGGRYEPDPQIVKLMELALAHFRYQQRAVVPMAFGDDELRAARVRTLVLVGDKELVYDPRAALERASSLLPLAEAELVPNAGHLLGMERADLVDARVLRFLGERRVQ